MQERSKTFLGVHENVVGEVKFSGNKPIDIFAYFKAHTGLATPTTVTCENQLSRISRGLLRVAKRACCKFTSINCGSLSPALANDHETVFISIDLDKAQKLVTDIDTVLLESLLQRSIATFSVSTTKIASSSRTKY